MSSSSQPLSTFVELTGADEATALFFLESCGYDLGAAASAYWEQQGSEQHSTASSANSRSSAVGDSDVPAPLPAREDQLYTTPAAAGLGGFKLGQVHIDPFRSFKAEFDPSSSTRPLDKFMYSPPVDLLFRGSFEEGVSAALSSHRWLVVNLQEPLEFRCSTLNREVWSHASMRRLLQGPLLLLQIIAKSGEGHKYKTLYKARREPHIAIIDPRTKQKMWSWEPKDNKATREVFLADKFVKQLDDFLAHNSLSDFRAPKRVADRVKPLDQLTEEENMLRAMAESAEEAEAEERAKAEEAEEIVLSDDEQSPRGEAAVSDEEDEDEVVVWDARKKRRRVRQQLHSEEEEEADEVYEEKVEAFISDDEQRQSADEREADGLRQGSDDELTIVSAVKRQKVRVHEPVHAHHSPAANGAAAANGGPQPKPPPAAEAATSARSSSPPHFAANGGSSSSTPQISSSSAPPSSAVASSSSPSPPTSSSPSAAASVSPSSPPVPSVGVAEVPSEPPAGHAGVVRVQFRLPGGSTVQCRFNATSAAAGVHAFIEQSLQRLAGEAGGSGGGAAGREFRVLSMHPRREIDLLGDGQSTLRSLNVGNAALIVEWKE